MFKKIIQAIPIGVCSGVIILLIAYFSLVPHPVGSGMLTFKHADKVAHGLMYFVATCVFVLDYARYKNPHHTRISFELMLMCASMVLGLVLAVVLFMWFPSAIIKLIDKHIIALNAVVKNIIEGVLKIAIFCGYTALTSLMPDMKRLYEYHGAEHKTIACYEHEVELTPENVKRFTRFHPRCGPSFIFLVLFISIFVNTIFRVSWASLPLRVLIKICLLPVVTGIAYELIRLAGKYENPVTKCFSAPGLWIQRITTREPKEDEIECAIAALKAVIPENKEDDVW